MKLILPLVLLLAAPAFAESLFDPDYPGSQVIADGKGLVHVRVVHYANEACWTIASAREGVPDPKVDMPTGRHLYVTVQLKKTAIPCALTNVPITTELTIPDHEGTMSLDIFLLDDKGFRTRSQKHRIERN